MTQEERIEETARRIQVHCAQTMEKVTAACRPEMMHVVTRLAGAWEGLFGSEQDDYLSLARGIAEVLIAPVNGPGARRDPSNHAKPRKPRKPLKKPLKRAAKIHVPRPVAAALEQAG